MNEYEFTDDGIAYRPGTADDWVLREHGYEKLIRRLAAGDRFLDLGGYVGSIAARAAKAGADVLAIEASPINYELLKLNGERFRFGTLWGAVVPSGFFGDRVAFYESPDDRRRPFGSINSKRGYDEISVPAFRVSEIAREFKPSFVKVDIEGTECSIVRDLDLDQLTGLAVEYDLQRRGQRAEAESVDDRVRDSGLECGALRVAEHSSKVWSVTKVYLRRE